MGAQEAMDTMPQRNRAVQREARKIRDRQNNGPSYTEARSSVRRGQRRVRMLPAPAMVDTTLWSRYGRWAFGTDDWQQWLFRTGCGHTQSPRDVATAFLGTRPELALTHCFRHGSGADPEVCPPVGSPGTQYYSVFWWHAKTAVFPFAFDEPYVVHGPLTEADDRDVVVPGITRPLEVPAG